MAAGDRLIDADGNVLVDSDGNGVVKDANDECPECCGGLFKLTECPGGADNTIITDDSNADLTAITESSLGDFVDANGDSNGRVVHLDDGVCYTVDEASSGTPVAVIADASFDSCTDCDCADSCPDCPPDSLANSTSDIMFDQVSLICEYNNSDCTKFDSEDKLVRGGPDGNSSAIFRHVECNKWISDPDVGDGMRERIWFGASSSCGAEDTTKVGDFTAKTFLRWLCNGSSSRWQISIGDDSSWKDFFDELVNKIDGLDTCDGIAQDGSDCDNGTRIDAITDIMEAP